MVFLNINDVYRAAKRELSDRFGDNVKVEKVDSQIVILIDDGFFYDTMSRYIPKVESPEFIRIDEFTYHRDALEFNNLPFKIIASELRLRVPKPPENVVPITQWNGDGTEDRTCEDMIEQYIKIQALLNQRYSARSRKNKEVDKYQTVFTVEKKRNKEPLQCSLENYGIHRRSTLRMQPDLIFETEKDELLAAEVKPASTLREKELARRAWQLEAYDALLAYAQNYRMPLLYIEPTVASHLEKKLLLNLLPERPVIPACVSTSEYLDISLKRRITSSIYISRRRSKEISSVVRAHRRELRYLLKLSKTLRERNILN